MTTTHHFRPALRRVAVAVQVALSALAVAQTTPDPAFIELTTPVNTLEIGVGTQSQSSAKANEYSGIVGKHPYVIGNFDLSGGGTFNSDNATRWRLFGSNLGLNSRAVDGEYAMQGRFRVKLAFDELQRNQSDTYQTPYLGAGGNTLMLPSSWLAVVVPRVSATAPNVRGLSPAVTASSVIVGGVLTPPTAAQAATAAAIQAADLPAFRQVDIFTRRTRGTVGFDLELGGNWSLSTSFEREHRDGLRPQGAQSRATDGDTSSILPTPIDEDDNRINVGVNYTGEALQLQATYDGSIFRNNIPSVTWNLWAKPSVSETMATAPSNMFHKLSLSGGYQFSPQTRLLAAASYGRATQNETFLKDPTAPLVPVNSANALVITESATVKLLHRLGSAANLSAAYKYELRENRTPVNVYGFYDNNNAPTGTSPFAYLYPQLTGLGQNFNFNANTPYSRRVHQVNLDADYRLKSTQTFKLGVEGKSTDRYCLGSWINCADAQSATEGTVRAEWRANPMDGVTTRVVLSAAERHVDYDENAFLAVVPMANRSPSTATGGILGSTPYSALVALGLTGYGPIRGVTPTAPAGSLLGFYFPLNNVLNNLLYGNENRISELVGMRRYDQADRNRESVRSSANWQMTDTLGLQGGLDYNRDRYTKSVYGLQRASNWAANIDGTYAPSQDLTLSLFSTFEMQRSRMASNTYTANSTATAVNGATAIDGGCYATIALRNANNKIDPCLDWRSLTRDQTLTVGTSFTAGRLLAGKLALTGSAVYSLGKTDIDVTGGNYVNNPYAGVAGNSTSAIAAYYIKAEPLPTVRIRSFKLQLAGTYSVNRDSAIRVGYAYQQLRSSDWAYESMQPGTVTQTLPTYEQSPRFKVHSVGVAYVANFR